MERSPAQERKGLHPSAQHRVSAARDGRVRQADVKITPHDPEHAEEAPLGPDDGMVSGATLPVRLAPADLAELQDPGAVLSPGTDITVAEATAVNENLLAVIEAVLPENDTSFADDDEDEADLTGDAFLQWWLRLISGPQPDHLWLERAACTGAQASSFVNHFFVGAGSFLAREELALCRGCGVRSDCLQHAYVRRLHSGYYGGLSPGQRDGMTLTEALAYIQLDTDASGGGEGLLREGELQACERLMQRGGELGAIAEQIVDYMYQAQDLGEGDAAEALLQRARVLLVTTSWE